jgi:MFS transporter, DHA1 family, tetracycline resistance protein
MPPLNAPRPNTQRQAALVFIFITVLMDMLAFGIIIPVLPKLTLSMTGGDAQHAADWSGWLGAGWALMQFIWSPIMGALSDRYGRRPVILISNFGLAADYVLIALAPTLWWILVARLISGAVSASITTANAYIADVTPPDERAKAFGMLGAAFGVGFVIGPAFGGWLGHYDPRWPFWGAAVMALLNGIYGLFVLPESLPRDKRTSFSWTKANPAGGFRFLQERPGLMGFAGLNFIAALAHSSLPSIFVLYAMTRYGWGPKEAGFMMAAVGVSSIVVQGFLVGKLMPWLGEARAMFFGYLCGALGFGIYAWAPQGPWLFVGIGFMALWGFAGPAVQSRISQQVDAGDQGKLQGMNSGVVALASMFGPLLYNQSLKFGIATKASLGLPGLPFYIAAVLLLLCALFSTRIMRATVAAA